MFSGEYKWKHNYREDKIPSLDYIFVWRTYVTIDVVHDYNSDYSQKVLKMHIHARSVSFRYHDYLIWKVIDLSIRENEYVLWNMRDDCIDRIEKPWLYRSACVCAKGKCLFVEAQKFESRWAFDVEFAVVTPCFVATSKQRPAFSGNTIWKALTETSLF